MKKNQMKWKNKILKMETLRNTKQIEIIKQ